MREARKRQQWMIFGVIGGVLLLIIIVLGQVMNSRQAAFQSTGGPNSVDETIIADRTSQASPEITWVRQSREEIDRLSKTVTELTQSVNTLTESHAMQIDEIRSEYDSAIIAQQAEINALRDGGQGVGQSIPPGAVLGQNGENYGQEFIAGAGGKTVAPGPGATARSARSAT